jgi:hypothetical protein
MINTCVLIHRPAAFLFFLILFANCSAVPSPIPIPPNECSVTPPILQAAIPVDAVTATASTERQYFFFKERMISLSRTDFPVPADYHQFTYTEEAQFMFKVLTGTSSEEYVFAFGHQT